jgi:TetR/AcrR family transcriptional repressor of nem operon
MVGRHEARPLSRRRLGRVMPAGAKLGLRSALITIVLDTITVVIMIGRVTRRESIERGRGASKGSRDLHAEILDAVVPVLKTHGVSAPVDQLMRAAGLTSGALYSHFKKKEDLCTQAICVALDQAIERYRRIVREQGREGLKFIVEEYLSEAHANGVAVGCTFAALGADMAKASAGAKRAYELRITRLVELFAEGLAIGPEKERRAKAQHVLSAMLGAITFARSMRDQTAIKEFLLHVKGSLHRQLDGA